MNLLLRTLFNGAKLSTASQILVFLPLTLSTISKSAFLLLSFLLSVHSLIHGTMILLWGSEVLSFLQVPVHPFLLLLCFNLFSSSHEGILWFISAAEWWGVFLRLSTPIFIGLEGISSLLVAQVCGQKSRQLASKGEEWQFSLLVLAAVAYVASATIIVLVCTRLLLRFGEVQWDRRRFLLLQFLHWQQVCSEQVSHPLYF